MFVSRTDELAVLQKLYDRDKFQMAVIYGRRRVGKTMLISEFIKDKPAIFFSAQEANEQMNLRIFSEKTYEFFNLPRDTSIFADWFDALSFVATKANNMKFVLAIDEYPYIAESSKGMSSILQNIIDHKLLSSNILLILCGSHIGFMENQVLGYRSPLFGRRTAQFKIEGFDYYDSAKMLGDVSHEDKVKYYACVGGTPHYLAQVDPGLSFEENIRDLFFHPQGYLYAEPTMLLQQELREPAMYNSILAAIATGSSRLNDISTKICEPTSKTIKYIKTLIALKILHKLYPFGDNPERSRKCLYAISDNCFRFWYKYVFMNNAAIETGIGEDIAQNIVYPSLPAFIGKPVFEEICKQYIIRQNKKRELPFTALSYGSWWGQSPDDKVQTDIDIVADNGQEKKVLICECKWTNHAPGAAEVDKLLSKAKLLPGYNEYHFMFFSKYPFEGSPLRTKAERSNLSFVALDDLYK